MIVEVSSDQDLNRVASPVLVLIPFATSTITVVCVFILWLWALPVGSLLEIYYIKKHKLHLFSKVYDSFSPRTGGGRKRNTKIILPKAEVRNEQKLESKRFGLHRIQGRLCREKVSFRRRPKVYGNETKEQTEGLRTTFV